MRIVDRPVCLNQRVTLKPVFLTNILCDGDAESALYALVLLELEVGPLTFVDKLLQCLL